MAEEWKERYAPTDYRPGSENAMRVAGTFRGTLHHEHPHVPGHAHCSTDVQLDIDAATSEWPEDRRCQKCLRLRPYYEPPA